MSAAARGSGRAEKCRCDHPMKKILIVLLAVVATSLGPLAAPVRAQIALPGLSAGGDAKKAPAAEQVPKRERILAQIEEAERRRNEALRLRPTYTGEDAVHATEVQHLLDRLTVVERDKLKRLNELEMAQKAMPPSIETWPVVRELSGPPPYSALRVDALRGARGARGGVRISAAPPHRAAAGTAMQGAHSR